MTSGQARAWLQKRTIGEIEQLLKGWSVSTGSAWLEIQLARNVFGIRADASCGILGQLTWLLDAMALAIAAGEMTADTAVVASDQGAP